MGKKENLERDRNMKDIEKHSRDMHEKMGLEHKDNAKSKNNQVHHDRHGRSGGSSEPLGSENGARMDISGRRRGRDQKSSSLSPC